jgi:AcrR family transcriptional regulator
MRRHRGRSTVGGVTKATAPSATRKAKTSPAPRRRARRGEGERLRDEILEAATDLLIETGSADKVSTRAVAQRVGCTSPSIYLHFPDKAALMYAVCERQFDTLGEVLEKALADIDDPVERLRAGARTYAEFALEHPEQYRVMMMDEAYAELYEDTLDHLGSSPGFQTIVHAVEDGIESGQLAPGDPVMIALTLWAAVHGMVSLLIVKPKLELPALDVLIDHLCQQNIEGLRNRTPARRRAR